MNFDDFPLEVKYKIFSFFTQRELSEIIAVVSEEWRRISISPFLRRQFTVNQPDRKQTNFWKTIVEYIDESSQLHRLIFKKIDEWSWTNWLPNRPTLRILEFNECEFKSVDVVFDLLRRFPLIHTITVDNCELKRRDFVNDDNFPDLELLKTVNLRSMYGIGTTWLKVFSKKCPNLENVEIRDNISVPLVLEFLNLHGSRLKKLEMHGVFFRKDDYAPLNQCRQLVELYICPNFSLTDEELKVFKDLTELRELSLVWLESVSSTALLNLFAGKNFPNLVDLELSNSSTLNDDGLKSLAENCPLLQSLSLQHMSLPSDVGIQYIMDYCRDLEVFHCYYLKRLQGNFLSEIPKKWPKLKIISLSDCCVINDEDLKKFKKENPNIRVYVKMED